MWAAVRCRAALWGMPPLRSAPTISSSNSQRICDQRAPQEVAKGSSLAHCLGSTGGHCLSAGMLQSQDSIRLVGRPGTGTQAG